MRVVLLSVSSAVMFLSAAVHAQEAPGLTPKQAKSVDRLIEAGLEDDHAYEILESLTTEIGPRLGGSEAEARARDWGAEKLKSLGFKNVRIETFDMPYWERVEESARIAAPFEQELKITALGNSVATPQDGLTGEIVRFETLLDLRDAPLEGLEGKIVFVDEVMTRTQDGSGYGWAVAKRSGAANEAAKRGAAAALIRSAGTSRSRTPHTGNMNYDQNISPVPIAALSNPDADLLGSALSLADGPVSVTLDISVRTKTSVESGNVIGEIPGKTDEIILIGGHLDSWDLGTGAVDDGAGIAITTAAAKLIDELPGRPTRTIRVIMWGSEEVGLLGARAYAAAHAGELDRHILASESDFGAGKVWRFRTRFGEDALPKAAVYQKALRRLGIGPGDNNSNGGPDVIPLVQAGVPAFRLTQDGTDYFDLHHTMDDTLDKVDPDALRQNVAAWAAAVYIASELEGDYR